MSELHLREVAGFCTKAYPVNAAYPGPDKKNPCMGEGHGPGENESGQDGQHYGWVKMRGRFWPIAACTERQHSARSSRSLRKANSYSFI
jgi:hypothetical protein